MLKGYLAISSLVCIDVLLYLTSGISLIGQISDKVLFWSYLIMTPIVIVKYFSKQWTKWYLGCIGILLIISLFPMAVPLLSVVAIAIDTDSEKKIENYRLREGAKSAIALPKIYLLKNWGFLEKEIGETSYTIEIDDNHYRLDEIEEIKLLKERDSLTFEFKVNETSALRSFRNQ